MNLLEALLRLVGPPPMEPTCTPQDLADATVAALRRIERYEAERAIRMAGYERTWGRGEVRPVLMWSRAWDGR